MEVQLDRVDHKGRTRFADLELAQKLIAEAPDDDLRFILFSGFHVGMRRLEIVEARPEWFNLRARTLEILTTDTFRPKDRNARTVPLTDQFAEFLERYGLRAPFVQKPEVGHGRFRCRYDIRRPFMLYMKAQGVEWLAPHAEENVTTLCQIDLTTAQKNDQRYYPEDHIVVFNKKIGR
jgi:integrase